ncbi:glycosyltransferase [Candidatus Dependentiae bacterium]|nr:glycosyltransferase [Candidatus Dependentiae bacterium]
MKISIIIPANNEEKNIRKCLESIKNANVPQHIDIEIIVVLNRCTDMTEKIAKEYGAITILDESRCLSKIRNHGVKYSTGEILVTIDADSWMTDNMLRNIINLLAQKKYIGGGVKVYPERYSLGIKLTWFLLDLSMLITGLSGGLYWCYKNDFDAIGGFDEELSFGEDLDFAKRLRKYGKTKGLKYKTITDSFIITSCRKFDFFGDWFIFKLMFFNQIDIIKGLKKKNNKFADKYFYDFNR